MSEYCKNCKELADKVSELETRLKNTLAGKIKDYNELTERIEKLEADRDKLVREAKEMKDEYCKQIASEKNWRLG